MIILMLHFPPQIEVYDSYNPLLVQSNLYKCLIAQSIKSNSVSKSVKRKFQAPQVGRIQLSTHYTLHEPIKMITVVGIIRKYFIIIVGFVLGNFRNLRLPSKREGVINRWQINNQRGQHLERKCNKWFSQHLTKPFLTLHKTSLDLRPPYFPLPNASDQILRQTYITATHQHFLTTCSWIYS